MGSLLALIPGKFYAYAAVVLLVIGEGVAIKIESTRLKSAQDNIVLYKKAIKVAGDANTTDEKTIATLKAANEQYASLLSTSEAARQKAIDDATTARADAATARKNFQKDLQHDQQRPDCQKILAMDLGVCTDVAHSLYQRAASLRAH